MRRYLFAVCALAALGAETTSFAGTFESVGAADFWHNTGAWALVEGLDEGGDGIPSAGDNVIIKSGTLIEMHAAHTAADVTIHGTLRGSTNAAVFNLTQDLGNVTVKAGGVFEIADGREDETVVMNISGDLNLEAGSLVKATAFSGFSQVTLNLSGNYTDANTGGFALYGGGTTSWTFNFTGDQPATLSMTPGASRDFANVVISSGKELTIDSTNTIFITAGNTFLVQTGASLLLGNGAFFSGPGSFNLEAGGTLGVAAAHGVLKSALFQNSGSTGLSSSANYVFNGLLGQDTGADLPTAVNSLTIDTPDWVTLSQSVNVSGNLVLENGRLETNEHIVYAGQQESQIVRTNGYVEGNLARTFDAADTGARLFPVGTEGAYLPVTVDITSAGTGFGFLTVSAIEGQFTPAPTLPALPYYWNISPGIFSSFTAQLKFGYSQDGAPATESGLRMTRYADSAFTTPSGQSVDTSANIITVPGVTGFSSWVPVVTDSSVSDWTVY